MLPLAGIRVVDLSRLLPGPLATLILADLGAEVIKVEDPEGGDYLRALPPLHSDGISIYFHAVNRGKKSVTLDLKQEADRRRFLELLESADVLVENFRPGVMKKLGLTPPDLQKRFPKLVICSITGYGQNGPMAKRAGHDLNFVANAGILGHMNPPVPLPALVADIAGGTWPAALQIVAALYGAKMHGKGCWIDVSITAFASSLLIFDWVSALNPPDADDTQTDIVSGVFPCYNIYPTRDGHLAVAALEAKFWNVMVQTLALDHFKDQGFATGAESKTIKEALTQAFMAKSTQEWAPIWAKADCCVDPIVHLKSVVDSSLLQTLRHPDMPVLPILPLTQALSANSGQRAPRLGAHNEELIR